MSRIDRTGFPATGTNLNTLTQSGTSAQPAQVGRTLGEQVQQNLFGRPRPRLLDDAEAPDLEGLLRLLRQWRGKLDAFAGEPQGGALVLSADTIAAIDESGTIYVGASFLRTHELDLEVLVGVLAHEVGHRPRYWSGLRAQLAPNLSAADLDLICRQEEIRADIFAGRALAHFGMAAAPLADFVRLVGAQPHPRYLAGNERAEVIVEAHRSGTYAEGVKQKLYPDYARATSARDFLGEA